MKLVNQISMIDEDGNPVSLFTCSTACENFFAECEFADPEKGDDTPSETCPVMIAIRAKTAKKVDTFTFPAIPPDPDAADPNPLVDPDPDTLDPTEN